MQKPKIAACLHVFYLEMWDQLHSYLANFPERADIFITCPPDIATTLSEFVKRDLPRAKLHIMPNLGMDVLPFLALVREKQLYAYDAILKLHSKNQKNQHRADQGKVMLDALCGTPQLVDEIIDLFAKTTNLGMLASAFQLRSADALMYGNREQVEKIRHKLDIPLDDWPFFTGTMFWIAGRHLRKISQALPELMADSISSHGVETGGDGSFAHALERIFGALVLSENGQFYLTEPKDHSRKDHIILPLAQHAPAQSAAFLASDSTILLSRYVNANHWAENITRHQAFDPEYYRKNLIGHDIPKMDALMHFILYGDLLGQDPSPHFDVNFYQLRRGVNSGVCSLAQSLHDHGAAGAKLMPQPQDWLDLGRQLGWIVPSYYAKSYPDVAYSGLPALRHYQLIGQRLKRKSSALFAPENIPALQDEDAQTLPTFLQRHALQEAHLYDLLTRQIANKDMRGTAKTAAKIAQTFGPNPSLLAHWAKALTLLGQEAAAAEIWAQYHHSPSGQPRHALPPLIQNLPFKPQSGFDIGPETANKAKPICIYTCLIGNDSLLPALFQKVEGVDFICITDRPRQSFGWQEVIVPICAQEALKPKIMPHLYLGEYDYSLYIAPESILAGRLKELLRLCRKQGDFFLSGEADDCATLTALQSPDYNPAAILAQLSQKAADMPAVHYQSTFIWRHHKAQNIQSLMQMWWDEITPIGANEDLALTSLLRDQEKQPQTLPKALGKPRDNLYFFAPLRKLLTPPLSGRTRDVTFLYDSRHIQTGSTVLRGAQMSDLVKTHFQDKRQVRYACDPRGIKDQVVILTKGLLKETHIDSLEDIRAQGNILLADFVDDPVNEKLLPALDGLIASSQIGYREYLSRHPNLPVFHVTHHVDSRLPAGNLVAQGQFRCGYFGELVNTIQDPVLEALVDFQSVSTARQDNSWMSNLRNYNFHYALRKRQEIDGAKPFLKGFVAAHCQANMIIQRGAGDAFYYLGADYPYLVDDDTNPEEIAEILKEAAENIGGPDWLLARDIMRDLQARSCVDYVMQEFEAMLKRVG